MRKLTPSRIRKLRRTLGVSRKDFGDVLWAAPPTVRQWETGQCAPVGTHQRLLALLDQALANPSVRLTLMDTRARDPLFLLYRLLEPLYGGRSAKKA